MAGLFWGKTIILELVDDSVHFRFVFIRVNSRLNSYLRLSAQICGKEFLCDLRVLGGKYFWLNAYTLFNLCTS